MRIAVVAVTKQGVRLAERVASLLADSKKYDTVLYVPGKFSLLGIEGKRHPYRKPLKELMGDLFNEYDGIICIMALGIVVRLAAPHLRHKASDPAVVVMDELAQNVISVLSGHWGGANALTTEIADLMGANAVITTATDVNGLPAIEMIARERGWTVEPFDLVRRVNSAIVNGRKVTIYSEVPLDISPTENIEVKDFAEYSPGRREENRVVLITNRTARSFPGGTLFLRPRNLCIGVGCRRGVTAREVEDAITSALEESGRTLVSVRSLASIDIKSGEQGLLQAADGFNLPVKFFTPGEILELQKERGSELSYSETVEEKIGVGGVCEPAAIMGAGKSSKLLMPKTKYGKVTIAIAEGDWQ